MMILTALVEATRKRVEHMKNKLPFREIKAAALAQRKEEDTGNDHAFERSLRSEGLSFICEIKKASPSKGVISPHFPYKEIARQYEGAGAHAISVLTEPDYFQGSSKYLREIRGLVSIPLLRKDFIIDEYQIYESKLMGADAVLLICALLNGDTLERYIRLCDSLGLSHLAEIHNAQEANVAVQAGARVIGINNRNLKNFKVDMENSLILRDTIPTDRLCIAESGIRTREEIIMLEEGKFHGVLIGETLMRSENIGAEPGWKGALRC